VVHICVGDGLVVLIGLSRPNAGGMFFRIRQLEVNNVNECSRAVFLFVFHLL